MLARRTNETESGFLPTPVKYDALGTWESNNNHGLGWYAKHVWNDDPLAKHKNTPMAEKKFKPENERSRLVIEAARKVEAGRQARARVRTLFPTPMANDAQKRGNFDINQPRNRLPAAVRRERVRVETFPTPIRNDAHGGNDAAGREGGQSLKQRIRTIGTPTAQNGLRGGSNSEHRPRMYGSPGDDDFGELNPDWVEWLMYWPYGWTSLEPIEEFEGWLAKAGDPWSFDPSIDGAIPRSKAGPKHPRVERICAIGNGQVPAVVAAMFLHLSSISFDDIPPDTINIED